MFGIGPQELILIVVGALIIFGPQRLPEIAAQVGKSIRDFRRMSDDLTGEFQRSMSLDEPPKVEPPALASAGIPANATPNGIGDAIAQSLRVETVPAETEEAPPAEETTVAPNQPSAPQDTVISLAPVATKTDALIGVSLLDEPTPYVGKTSVERGPTEGESVAEAVPIETDIAAASYVYEPSPIPDNSPLALDAAPELTGESEAVRSQSSITDAWDAVISTEATAGIAVIEPETATDVPVPLYPAGTYATESSPFAEPQRERVDPVAEPTIREKIEAQVAAEAFRERRRVAHYQRTREKRS